MAEKRLSHAYMLVGPEDPSRDEAARRLTAALLCPAPNAPCGQCRDCRKVQSGSHPDAMTVQRLLNEKKELRREILVEQIRQMTADAMLAPNEAARKVYVIRDADRMNIQAQNALLKALEDPPGHACFILCAASADALLPTVRSRCVRAEETLGRERTVGPLSELAGAYLNLAAAGDPADVAMFCLLRDKMTREDMENFTGEVKDAVCDMLCGRRAAPGLDRDRLFHLAELMETVEDYLRHNVGIKQISGLLAVETLK